MLEIQNSGKVCFDSIPIDSFWNLGDEKELKLHRAHSYPAKFPAFLTTKALEYAEKNHIYPKQIADIFCGCGTVALEAKRSGIDFWGCDINPVATMIAKTKSRKYLNGILEKYLANILELFDEYSRDVSQFDVANERLKYWYKKQQYDDLYNLKKAIFGALPDSSDYRNYFLCAFSNILKPTSVWLTKSIKPQVDPNKVPADVLQAFKEQCAFMSKANEESDAGGASVVEILNTNVLDGDVDHPVVDMIVTSPPYVTSYEYADLHQLSSLWLGYAEDYKSLRVGSIGSSHNLDFNFTKQIKKLNKAGMGIVLSLRDRDKAKSKAVAKYFLDMQEVTEKCHEMLAEEGIAVFVIGDTEYKGVRIENAKHLTESLYESGFTSVSASKREIRNKILTPYRTKSGKFTSDKSGRKIYSEEFIIVATK